jgi:hypothetical protein
MIKNELNLSIMMQFVDVLRDIEEGKIDQHEGSYKVGKILKELYIDTALRKEQKLEALGALGGGKNKKVKAPSTGKKLTYAEFKKNKEV